MNDAFKWRLLTSPDLRVTLEEYETHWSWRDAMEAHFVLDAIDEARSAALRKQRKG